MKLRTLPILLAALLTASAAASAADDVVIRSSRAQVEAFAGAAVESVTRKPMRDNERWETLDDYALLIWESPSRAWLVDLERDGDARCADLSSEYLMHLDSRVNWLSSRNGYVELRNGWCKITSIRPVDVKALRAARKSQGIRSAY
jgi:hypothetical protein